MFRGNNFDKLLDKATSNLRLDPDWPTILQICDLIRQNDCSPKYAVTAVKKKLCSPNPHQAMFALLVLESIVKNCGSGVHDEVASKGFCEMLRDLVKTSQHENLKTKILELIQAWAFAFRNTPKYRAVQDTVNILKAEGYKFPALKESDAMFSADTAPEWAEGEVCHRCRVAFSLILRRHHCRACGQVFCQQCSAKSSTIPKYGIEKEVRVCDACYEKMNRPLSTPTKLEIVDTASDYGPAQQPQKKAGKSAEELQEEEELQLALALSQSEAEHKEKERKTRPYSAPEPVPQLPSVSPTPSSVSASPEHSAGAANPELSRYLDRGYWEQRLAREGTSAAPTAPASHPTLSPADDYAKSNSSKMQEEDAEDRELDEFVGTLKCQVEIFVNRMKSNSSRGRSIANDSSVQTLFMNITAMHSRLLRYIQQQDDKRVYLESLQDKVTQVRDSRAALDTLRAEHAARLAAAAEAADRQRQMQMATKLQAMRKKKHEYLQYQRQLALQRVQEQEREMQMRQEQQKHQYMMSAGGGFYMPGVSMHQFQSGFPNQQMYSNPQFSSQMLPQSTADTAMAMPGQPQMSQANMPMGVNQMGAVSQSMPQLTQSYPMTTTGMAMSQTPISTQASMNQSNLRASLGQQLPLHSQLLMQHAMQLRMPVQPGVHQMVPQNMTNGLPGQQNVPQSNQQPSQMPKQTIPNQVPQGSNALMAQIPSGQQNFGQPQLNNANQILAMQMQNLRMQSNQGNQMNPGAQGSVPGYTMAHLQNQNIQLPSPQSHNLQSQQQLHMPSQLPPGQQMMQGQPIQNQNPPQIGTTNQNIPSHGNQVPSQNQQIQSQGQHVPHAQVTQGQTMPQGQHIQSGPQIQGQHMLPQGQPPPPQQHVPQGQQMLNQGHGPMQAPQVMNQGQQLPNAGQHMIHGQTIPAHTQQLQQQMPQQNIQMAMPPQQMPGQGHQMATQGHQLPAHPQNLQQQMAPQGQQASQGIPPGQQIKMQQQNFTPVAQQPPPNQQIQQVQNPAKSEHNNNTAELISFD